MRLRLVSGISSGFPGLFQSLGQVTHVLLTRSPLITREQALEVTVRLACVKHAASVRPEPGSNSPLMFATHHDKRGRKSETPQRVVKLTEQEQLAKLLAFNDQPKDFRSKATQPPPKDRSHATPETR
jgi:hypothetical protein